MKCLNKILLGLLIPCSFIITGCASNQQKNILSDNNITIERVDSKKARVGLVNVVESNGGIEIRGEVRRRSNTRGFIPGHMDIDIVGNDGQVISKSNTHYKRKSRKSKTAKFRLKLDSVPKDNYTIKVAHHYAINSKPFCCHSNIEQ